MFAPWYDAILKFFERVEHVGKPVVVVFASPDRAHTEVTRVTKKRSQGQRRPDGVPLPEIEERPTPTPFMSVWMQPPRYDPALFNPGQIAFDFDKRAGTAKKMRWPRPYEAEVQVDLWCGGPGGNLIAMMLQAQIDQLFTAESAYLPVDWTETRWYRPPFNLLEYARNLGRTRIRFIHEGWTDTSDIEAGEGPKEIRRTFTGRVKDAYLAYRPEEARLVRTFGVEVFDDTTEPEPTLIDEIVGGAED